MPVHRSTAPPARVIASAQPFKVRAHSPVHFCRNPICRGHGLHSMENSLNRLRDFLRNFSAKRSVHFLEVLSVKLVELLIVRRAVLRTVPPTPIASFRRKQRFPGANEIRRRPIRGFSL